LVLVRNGEELSVDGRWLKHSGIQKFEKVLKYNRVDILNAELAGFCLFHSTGKQGSEKGTAGGEDGAVCIERLFTDEELDGIILSNLKEQKI